MTTVFKNLEESLTSKNYCPVGHFLVVNKIFEKFSTSGLLEFNCSSSDSISGATRAVALDMLKYFERVWHTDLLETQVLWNFRSGI